MLVCLNSNKGGTGKTTIATNLAISLSLLNKKVILVDLDGLGGVLFSFGKSFSDIEGKTILDLIEGKKELEDCLFNLSDKLDLLNADPELEQWNELVIKNSKLQINLEQLLDWLNNHYDYVVIDLPPQFSKLNELVLKVSDLIIIPCELEQLNLFSTFTTLAKINQLEIKQPKLLILNKVKLDFLTNELKLTKAEQKGYQQLNHFINSLEDNKVYLSKINIPNSSQIKNVILNYNFPISAINLNAKPIKRIKDQFLNLANQIIDFKK